MSEFWATFPRHYPHVEKTDNAPRKNTFTSSSSWHSAGVGLIFSSSFHTHPQRGCVWKGKEKQHLTPALGQEWEEGNVFFLGALSVFPIRWYLANFLSLSGGVHG